MAEHKFNIVGTFPRFKTSRIARIQIYNATKSLLKNVKTTKYNVKKDNIVFNHVGRDYVSDCSSTVEVILGAAVPKHYEALMDEIGISSRRRILARYFAEYSKGIEIGERPISRYWYPIKYVRNVKKGDIFAVKYPPSKKATGHVMIIAATPEKVDKNLTLLKYGLTGVQLLHNSNQTKGSSGVYRARITHSAGGMGIINTEIWFVVDRKGRPVKIIREERNRLQIFPVMAFLRARTKI